MAIEMTIEIEDEEADSVTAYLIAYDPGYPAQSGGGPDSWDPGCPDSVEILTVTSEAGYPMEKPEEGSDGYEEIEEALIKAARAEADDGPDITLTAAGWGRY